MKLFFRITAIILLFMVAFAVFAADDSDLTEVRVYTGASAALLGRAVERDRKVTVPIGDFIESKSIETSAGGIATAVMINASVKKALDELLASEEFVIVEESVLKRMKKSDRDVYSFSWSRYGFEIEFSFDKTSPELISEIEKVYGDDAYLFGELKRSYDDNYSLRIFKAEDLYRPARQKIDFIEAMISATVIGSTFQPLFGIHDGLGVLDRLGLASAKAAVMGGDYLAYRQYEHDEEKILSFLDSIEGMEGDFIDNLYDAVKAISLKRSDDGRIMLPEDFFSERAGDNTDYALFYYDLLKREGYSVKFIVIDPGSGELYNTVFFREKGTDLWGRIDGNNLEREKAAKWQRMPALVFTASVSYFEPDITMIINDGVIELPPPSIWSLSPY
ncbi:MAG TPA: hypothetical protein DCO79_04430 [Spirochaeta sp.]|nr:hypothetical protein [Spirochaeta sp.]